MRGRRLSLRHSVKHYEASDPKSFMLRFICICSRVLFLLRSSDDVNSIALNIFRSMYSFAVLINLSFHGAKIGNKSETCKHLGKFFGVYIIEVEMESGVDKSDSSDS